MICLVRCSMCLRLWYFLHVRDVISLRTLENFLNRPLAMLEVAGIECQTACTMSFASIDMSQCFSKRKDLGVRLSILLNCSHRGRGQMWSWVNRLGTGCVR
jgi:hypothetical protein